MINQVAETYEHETEQARAAREHAQETREAGATYADAAKGETVTNGSAQANAAGHRV
jgi:hypothetical protein